MLIDIDDEVRRYVGERPPAAWAWMRDPEYRQQMETVRTLARMYDRAMADEHIPELVRLRVLRVALFGSPDPVEAVYRVSQREQLVKLLAMGPPDAQLAELIKGS